MPGREGDREEEGHPGLRGFELICVVGWISREGALATHAEEPIAEAEREIAARSPAGRYGVQRRRRAEGASGGGVVDPRSSQRARTSSRRRGSGP